MSEESRKILDMLGSDDTVAHRTYPQAVELSTEAKQTIGFSVMSIAEYLHVDPKVIVNAVAKHAEMYYTEPSDTLWIFLTSPDFPEIEGATLKIPKGEWTLKGLRSTS